MRSKRPCPPTMVWLLLAANTAVFAQTQKPLSTIEVQLPGYSVPVSGRWLGPGQNQSGIPLGGLGTGFIELRPDGLIHDTVLPNNWLKPEPVSGCGLTFSAINASAALLSTPSAAAGSLR